MKPVHVERIEWFAVAEFLPSDEATVLITDQDGDVFVAFLDHGLWRDMEMFPLSMAPIYWASLPEGPQP